MNMKEFQQFSTIERIKQMWMHNGNVALLMPTLSAQRRMSNRGAPSSSGTVGIAVKHKCQQSRKFTKAVLILKMSSKINFKIYIIVEFCD